MQNKKLYQTYIHYIQTLNIQKVYKIQIKLKIKERNEL